MPVKKQLRVQKSTVRSESQDSGESVLVKLEELIGNAFGSRDDNIVDFKMVQAIFHILAKRMHILQQNVEVRLYDVQDRVPDQPKPAERTELDKKQQQQSKKSGLKRSDVKDGQFDFDEEKREEKRESKTVHIETSVDQKTVHLATKSAARSDELDDDRRLEETRSLVQKEQLESCRKLAKQSIGRTSVGGESIQVANAEDFNELKDFVYRLHNFLAPIPEPSMPDNEKLKEDIVEGTSTLSDTMEALQINARINAAEDALKHMTDLLKKLVKAGALPSEVFHDLEDMQMELRELGVDNEVLEGEVRLSVTSQSESRRKSSAISSKLSIGPASKQNNNVMKNEIDTILEQYKKELSSHIESATSKALSSFAYTNHMVRTVTDKYDEITALDSRISGLDSLIADYTNQLMGCDTGNETQLKIFSDQMKMLWDDAAAGVKLIDSINTSEDTIAVKDLRRIYGELQKDLSYLTQTHMDLEVEQEKLRQNLTTLTAEVERLREQKADREEMEDAFRDKADMGRLNNLLKETAFSADRRKALQHFDKFYGQIRNERNVWEGCINDLSVMVNNKVNRQQLTDVHQNVVDKIKQIHADIKKIIAALSEPKAAMVTLSLLRTGNVPSQSTTPMALDDEVQSRPQLVAMPDQTQHDEIEDICVTTNLPIDHRKHACNRLVGGSHTMLTDSVTRQQAPQMELGDLNSVRSDGLGIDGHVYKMEQKEEDLQQCIECNKILQEVADPESKPMESGGGDQSLKVGTPMY